MNSFIPIAKPNIGLNEKKYIEDCITTGWVSSAGEYISKFEQINADYYKVKYGVAVANGTVALHMALVALDIGPGDEVIIPNLTFAATANAVLYTGAIPILADIEYDSWTIDIERAEKLVNDKTKAVIPVHLYGQPCNMRKVMSFAKKHNLFVIEDCAEAHGAEFKLKKIGSFGHINCFSFYGNKIITCGEGGICLTNNESLAEKLKLLRDHGMNKNKRYWHDILGFNYRITSMQAALGYAQMERIIEILDKRSTITKYYDDRLEHNSLLKIQCDITDRKKVCWLYSILIDTQRVEKDVDEIREELLKKNIDSRPFFFPLHQMPPYEHFRKNNPSISSIVSKKGLSLPTFENLSDEEIDYICDSLLSILIG